MTRPRRVLFVCTANICRSPTAEAVLRARAAARGLALEIDSAGLADHCVGDPPDPRSRGVAEARGYDLAPLRARQFTPADFDHFDHILVMDRGHLRAIERRHGRQPKVALFLEAARGGGPAREVPDPYAGDRRAFERVLELIEEGVEALIAGWSGEHDAPPDSRGT
jgi:protein-tyrosine phosphatase